jgi:hypothetical protein
MGILERLYACACSAGSCLALVGFAAPYRAAAPLGGVITAGPSAITAPAARMPLAEQTSFTEDGPLQSPVAISTDVLKALLETEAARQGLGLASKEQRDHPEQLFRAAQVHLSDSGDADLVVIGVCPMCGADNGWFWVVRSAAKSPKVVLIAGGKTLEVLNSSSKGYHDIQSVWSSPAETDTTIYRFNGLRYELRKHKTVRNAAR